MKQGVHKHLLQDALQQADKVAIFADEQVKWDINKLENNNISTFSDTQCLIDEVCQDRQPGDQIVIMSNGGFNNLHQRLIKQLSD